MCAVPLPHIRGLLDHVAAACPTFIAATATTRPAKQPTGRLIFEPWQTTPATTFEGARLKRQGGASRRCPLCQPKRRGDGRLAVPGEG